MKKLVIGNSIALLVVALAGSLLTASNGTTRVDIATKNMSASEVKLSNLSTFEAQLRHDIPLGTPKQSVETYLYRQKIPHFFADFSYGDSGNEFYATLKNIGERLGFPASLAIRIHLDQGEKVDKISFRVDYDAS